MAIYRLADGESTVGMAARVCPEHRDKGIALLLHYHAMKETAEQHPEISEGLWVAAMTANYKKFYARADVSIQDRIFVSVFGMSINK